MNLNHASPDDRLARVLRAYHELQMQALEAAGAQSPSPFTVVRRDAGELPAGRRVGPGVWVEARWATLSTAATPGWSNKAGRLRRCEDLPLDGWVQVFHKPGKPDPDARSGGQWYLRLIFPRTENPTQPQPDPLALYANSFFDVRCTRPGGRESRLHLRVSFDLQGDLASAWQPVDLGDPTDGELRVCFSADPVGAAEGSCTSRRPSAGHVRDGLDPLWDDLGGEA